MGVFGDTPAHSSIVVGFRPPSCGRPDPPLFADTTPLIKHPSVAEQESFISALEECALANPEILLTVFAEWPSARKKIETTDDFKSKRSRCVIRLCYFNTGQRARNPFVFRAIILASSRRLIRSGVELRGAIAGPAVLGASKSGGFSSAGRHPEKTRAPPPHGDGGVRKPSSAKSANLPIIVYVRFKPMYRSCGNEDSVSKLDEN